MSEDHVKRAGYSASITLATCQYQSLSATRHSTCRLQFDQRGNRRPTTYAYLGSLPLFAISVKRVYRKATIPRFLGNLVAESLLRREHDLAARTTRGVQASRHLFMSDQDGTVNPVGIAQHAHTPAVSSPSFRQHSLELHSTCSSAYQPRSSQQLTNRAK